MESKVKYTIKKATISDKIYFHKKDIIDISFQDFRYVLFNYNLGDRFYSTLDYDEETGNCSVPSGSWHKLNILELEDKRFSSPEYDWNFKGSLRPNQQDVADKIYSNNKLYSGLIQAPCGFGKSFLGGYLIAKNKKTTIIICHTKLLAEQWFNLLKEVIPTAEIGFIGDGKEVIKPITIAIYKSLLTRLSKIKNNFETIIVDECLDYETYIKTKNGRMKIGVIVNNKLPVEVESWNTESNCFEYKKVYNWFKNTHTDNFIKINTIPKGSISCTKNHAIYTYNFLTNSIERKLAENIEINDNLVCSPSRGKTISILNKKALPIVLGLILGDGSLEKNRKNNVTRIKITNGEKQLEYLKYKLSILDEFFYAEPYSSNSGYADTKVYSSSSLSFYDTFNLIDSLYDNKTIGNKNKITNELAELLTIESWSIIYQDDGSISSKSICFSLCEIPLEYITYLADSLKKLFNISEVHIYTCKKGFNYLKLSVANSKIFLKGIRHLIHPVMRYKDPYYSGEDFIPLHIKDVIKPFSIKKVTSIGTKKPTGSFRYNISVEDNHNYSTNTSLVGNCHLSPADTFSKVVNGINAKTKIGLSATPIRKDGLHVILPDYFGPNRLIAIDDSKLSASVDIIKTDIPFRIINPNRDWTKQLTKLSKNSKYLELIAQTVNDKIAHGRCPLILSERIEMLEELKTKIPSSVLLVGSTKNTDREDILQHAGTKYSAILSTRIFDEGISCHRLDTLVLTCPGNNYSKLEQRIGRILRSHPDKKDPLIIDFWLVSPIVYHQQQNRLEWYRKQNFEILNS
jgi:superfamily II DNA or RNA helicase